MRTPARPELVGIALNRATRRRHRTVQRRDPDVTVVLVRGDTEVAAWPLAGSDRPDLAVVDDLARMLLGARRLGCSVRLRGAGAALLELLDLVGLGDVALRQVVGKTEDGEQVGVDEVVVPDDPVA
jgi:hypothetical protein